MLSNDTADLLTELGSASAPGELWSATSDYLEKLGFSHSIYTFVKPGRSGATRIWTSLPEYWRDHYVDRQYARIDPYFRHCCNSFEPVPTGPDCITDHGFLTRAERTFIYEGGETGFRSGFSAPVRLIGDAGFGGWNFGSGLPRRQMEALLAEHGQDLRLAAFYTHEHAERLERADGAVSHRLQRLTGRERECLLWLSRGLRTVAIADRLGIAPVTVDVHFKGARRKLSAATREEALAKAILANLIDP